MPQVSCRLDGWGLGGGPPFPVTAIGSSASVGQRQRGAGALKLSFRPTNEDFIQPHFTSFHPDQMSTKRSLTIGLLMQVWSCMH